MNRATWVETLVPYGNQIISQLPNINWASFSYRGPVEIDMEDSPNNTGGFSLSAAGKSRREIVEATAKAERKPYTVFGGAACDLWASEIPKPNIREFVDPTGDIDVKVMLPDITVLKEHSGQYDDPSMYLTTDTGLTELGDQYSRWLFNEVVRVYSPLASDFDRPLFSVPDISEDGELQLADIAEFYGNLLFTRMVTRRGDNIKIQVSTKVSAEGRTVVSHLLEFMMLTRGQSYSEDIFLIRDIPVPSPWALFTQQVKGLSDRTIPISTYWQKRPNKHGRVNTIQMFYKVDNHCGRLLYLAQLQKQVEGKSWPFRSAAPQNYFQKLNIQQVLAGITPLFKTKSITYCGYHFQDFQTKLLAILDSYEFVKKGILTNSNSQVRKTLNSALRGGSTRRRQRRSEGGGCACGQIQKW